MEKRGNIILGITLDAIFIDTQHDLISNQVKTESAETSVKELEAKNKELLLNKARLEAALEDKLLDGKKDNHAKDSSKNNQK